MITAVGFVFLIVAVAHLFSRASTLEQAVADMQRRVGRLERPRPAPAVEHPPVVERRPVVPEAIRLKPDPPNVTTAIQPARPERAQRVEERERPPVTARVEGLKADPPVEGLESQIGARWLLYVGVVAIVVGIAYFEKLAIDNHWLTETARVIQGGIVGVALAAGGLRFVKRGYAVYGQMLSACGIAILYLSTYAAFNFYHLIARPPALLMMCGITALAAWLADRQRSQALAIFAVGGGFATPFLLPPAVDAQVALFSYETVLIAGTMYLAHRRTWPALNFASYVFTLVTMIAWTDTFYDPSKFLTTELFFTLFCAMYLYVLHASPWTGTTASSLARGALWSGPLFYYAGSLVVLGSHRLAELVFLILLSLAGAIIGLRQGADGTRSARVRLVFWLAAAAPMTGWLYEYQHVGGPAAGLIAIAAIYAVHLVGHLESTIEDDRVLSAADLALLHLNGLAAFAGAHWLISAVSSTWSAPVALLFACWHGAIARSIWNYQRDHALHFIAVAATLLVAAIGLQFHGAWVTMGWAAEGAAIIALGLRTEREWLRAGGALLLGVALLRLLGLQFLPPESGQQVLLNQRAACGLFMIALSYALAWFHQRYARPERQSTEVAMLLVLAKLLILSLVTSEIDAYWYSPRTPWRYIMAREALASIAWAGVGTAIAWLGLARERGWIRVVGGAVLLAGLARLLWLQAAGVPPHYVVLANPRFVASAAIVALLYALAARYRSTPSIDQALGLPAVLLIVANVLTLGYLTSEISAYWYVRAASDITYTNHLAREMMLSITWAAYATALITIGIRRQYAPIRYLAFVIFGLTILKVFAIDLAELDQIYRVSSIIALGVTLLVSSYLYHRFRDRLVES